MSSPRLAARGVRVEYPRAGAWRSAVDGVDLELQRGEIHALTGESGCGKSSLALALLGLSRAPGRVSAGSLECDGREHELRDPQAMLPLRGREIGLLLQESALALDPLRSVESQLLWSLRRVDGVASRSSLRARAAALLARLGFEDPTALLTRFPHELSGGMRQRVQLAAALALAPRYLVADEPTASLDTLLTRQILALLRELADRDGLGVLLVTHDLAAAGAVADRSSVMYAGAVVERGPTRDLLLSPRHPYTEALVRAAAAREPFDEPLAPLAGRAPALGEREPGCAFAPRCPWARDECRATTPALTRMLTRAGAERELACPPRGEAHGA